MQVSYQYMSETQNDVAQYQSDHDLLILLNERVLQLTLSVSSKTGDHETRIRFLERYVWLAMGALAIITFGLNFLK